MLKHSMLAIAMMLCVSMANAQAVAGSGRRSDRKIIEISKIVKLSGTQEETIRKAYDAYNMTVDSALYVEHDPVKAARMKYAANKKFNNTLMSTLSEGQRNRYIQITSVPDVEAKTEYNLSLLREGGEYSEDELAKMKKQIFEYLMREKLVYVRDKYDIAKQKDNIHKLKATQPRALKESSTREKMKARGKLNNGKVEW